MVAAKVIEEIRTRTSLTFSRSSGAGGQNVNKVSTKVTARLDPSKLSSLEPEEAERVRRSLSGRINAQGEIVLQADEERSQARNREIALLRMIALVLGGAARPKHRHPTRIPQSSRRARLEAKRHRASRKGMRGRIDPGD